MVFSTELFSFPHKDTAHGIFGQWGLWTKVGSSEQSEHRPSCVASRAIQSSNTNMAVPCPPILDKGPFVRMSVCSSHGHLHLLCSGPVSYPLQWLPDCGVLALHVLVCPFSRASSRLRFASRITYLTFTNEPETTWLTTWETMCQWLTILIHKSKSWPSFPQARTSCRLLLSSCECRRPSHCI
jgi:hypothetical protein